MATSYTNIVQPTMSLAHTTPNPLQNALNNKLNPSSLPPIGPLSHPAQPFTPANTTVGPAMQTSIDRANAAKTQPQTQPPVAKAPPAPPAYVPTGTTPTPPLISPNFSGVSGGSQPVPQNNLPSYSGLVGQLANKASQPSDAWNQAYGNYQDINAKLAQSKLNEANSLAGNSNDPVDLTFQQGRGQVLQNQYLQQQNALSSELQGATNVLGAANTQQGTQQSGLLGAISASAPSLGAYGQTYYSPLQGGAVGGQGIPPSDPFYGTMQTYAQLLVSNQPGTIPASITGNSVLNAQLQQMAKQINPNYNYNQAVGTGSAQQYNAQTGGTAGTQASQQVLNSANDAYTKMLQQSKNVANLGDSFIQNMIAGGINPTNSQFANILIKNIRNQFSNVQQQQFDNSYAQLKQVISGLLQTGGAETPTELTNDANLILNGNVSVGALQGVIDRINNTEVPILLRNQADTVNQAWTTLQNGGQPQNNNQSNGQPNPWH